VVPGSTRYPRSSQRRLAGGASHGGCCPPLPPGKHKLRVHDSTIQPRAAPGAVDTRQCQSPADRPGCLGCGKLTRTLGNGVRLGTGRVTRQVGHVRPTGPTSTAPELHLRSFGHGANWQRRRLTGRKCEFAQPFVGYASGFCPEDRMPPGVQCRLRRTLSDWFTFLAGAGVSKADIR
jgi:hypothetical protein